MSYIADYFRDMDLLRYSLIQTQRRDIADYDALYPLTPSQRQAYELYLARIARPVCATEGRRFSIDRPSVPWPHEWPRRSEFVWTCSYCGGMRGHDALRCEGCGAARSDK